MTQTDESRKDGVSLGKQWGSKKDGKPARGRHAAQDVIKATMVQEGMLLLLLAVFLVFMACAGDMYLGI